MGLPLTVGPHFGVEGTWGCLVGGEPSVDPGGSTANLAGHQNDHVQALGSKTMEHEKRGLELCKQADEALKRFSWFGLTNSMKYDEAIQLYTKAMNSFKLGQNWKNAAETYSKLADLTVKSGGSSYEIANSYIGAGEMYAKFDTSLAIENFNLGIKILYDEGRFGTAAKHFEALAQLQEKDNELSEAIKYYDSASNCFNLDNSSTRANKNIEKAAYLRAQIGEYKQAYEAFFGIGKSCLESNLLKFNAKKHFLHAGFCLLARNDLVAAEDALKAFKSLDYTFEEAREGKLMKDLIESIKEMDVDKFAQVLFAYDSISKLDPWETSLLLRVKGNIQGTTSELNGEDATAEPDLC